MSKAANGKLGTKESWGQWQSWHRKLPGANVDLATFKNCHESTMVSSADWQLMVSMKQSATKSSQHQLTSGTKVPGCYLNL